MRETPVHLRVPGAAYVVKEMAFTPRIRVSHPKSPLLQPSLCLAWPGGIFVPILQKSKLRLRGMCPSSVTQQEEQS